MSPELVHLISDEELRVRTLETLNQVIDDLGSNGHYEAMQNYAIIRKKLRDKLEMFNL